MNRARDGTIWTVGLRAAGFRAMDIKTMTRTNHNTDSDPSNLSSQDRTAYSPDNRPTDESDAQAAVATSLAAAGLDVKRLVPLRDGTKQSRVDHTDPGNQHPVGELDGNYGVMAGDGLVIVDIDDYCGNKGVPDSIEALPATFTVQTPHGGEHRYYAVNGAVNNSQNNWGEIRASNQYVVGPGSVLDSCSKDWHDCAQKTEGKYIVTCDRAIASIPVDSLPVKLHNAGTPPNRRDTNPAPGAIEIDEDTVAYAEECVREFRVDATQQAFDDLIDVLNGGTGNLSGLRHDDGTIDRDKADLEACWLLYGAMRYVGESPDRARELTSTLVTHYCNETPYMKDGRRRKWLRDEAYRQNRLDCAIGGFSPGAWHRWRRRSTYSCENSDEPRVYTGEYSEVSYDVVMAAVDILSGKLPPELISSTYGLDIDRIDINKPPTTCHKVSTQPTCGTSHSTKSEIIDLAQQIDPDRATDTHEEVLKRLQNQYRQVKAARMDSTTWVYYPAYLPDPPEACYVKCGGEKREPE